MSRAIPLNTVLTWAFAAVATTFAVLISVTFLDRLIAMIVREFAGTPSFFGPLAIFVLLNF